MPKPLRACCMCTMWLTMRRACRPNKAVASWPGYSYWHASKTLIIRLPTAQAYTAMYTLLEHPEVTMLHPAHAQPEGINVKASLQ
jgi:hypothetical protein